MSAGWHARQRAHGVDAGRRCGGRHGGERADAGHFVSMPRAAGPLLLDVLRHARCSGVSCSNTAGGFSILAQAGQKFSSPRLHAAAALPLQLRSCGVLRPSLEPNLKGAET